MKRRGYLGGLVCRAMAVAVLVLAGWAWACSVPVFRYALERWGADPYMAMVFHRGALTAEQAGAVKQLTGAAAGGGSGNVEVRMVDLEREVDAEAAAVWKEQKGATLPWVTVRFPRVTRLPGLVWAGPLGDAGLRAVVDSPVRRDVVRRLTQGDSVVWVLLEVGDKQRDDEAAKVLGERLAYLSSVLKLPKLDPQDVVSGADGQLRLGFSTVRIGRTAAGEQALVNMLVGSEADLHEVAEPLVFPVFGRGRVLYALAGKGINHENIDQAASFLIGSCSCEVKEQNPGVDLLVAADWERLFKPMLAPGRESDGVGDLTGAGKGLGKGNAGRAGGAEVNGGGQVEVVAIEAESTGGGQGGAGARWWWLGGLALGLLAVAAWVWGRR